MHTLGVFPSSWSCHAEAQGRMHAALQSVVAGIVVCVFEPLHGVPELGFAKKEEGIAAGDVRVAVAGGFG